MLGVRVLPLVLHLIDDGLAAILRRSSMRMARCKMQWARASSASTVWLTKVLESFIHNKVIIEERSMCDGHTAGMRPFRRQDCRQINLFVLIFKIHFNELSTTILRASLLIWFRHALIGS